MKLIRLDKFVSEHSEYSRSQIKVIARKGYIKVNGITEKSSDAKINPDEDVISVSGTVLRNQKNTYILLNKPEGYVCSTDEKDGKTVLELVPPELRNKDLFPAGRLDKDSLGALLITDDGELAHRILSPKSHIPKIYIVKLAKPFQIEYINKFAEGITLANGEVCLPTKVRPVENNAELAFIELCEGKYHQVKRMFASVGNHVDFLMRVSVGGLILPEKLGFGDCMELLHKNLEQLMNPPDFDDFCRKFSVHFSAIVINKFM